MKHIIVEVSQKWSNDFIIRLTSNKGRERWILFTYWATDKNKFNNVDKVCALNSSLYAVLYLAKKFKCEGFVRVDTGHLYSVSG